MRGDRRGRGSTVGALPPSPDSTTRLGQIAARLVESGCLAAIVAAPLFIDVSTRRVFEQEKMLLVRSLALVVGFGLLVRAGEGGRSAWQVAGRAVWRIPAVWAALALGAAYALSTIFGISPSLSFQGSYERMQGTYSWLGQATVFAGVLLVVRSRAQIERVLTAALIASVPAATYALLQYCGADPIRWASWVATRSPSTAGNPAFLAAFLIMVIPPTLARLVALLDPLLAEPSGDRPDRVGAGAAAAGCLAALALQIAALVCSQSRGALLGLGAGIVFFAAVSWLFGGRGRVAARTIAIAVGLGALVGPLTDLGPARYRYLHNLLDLRRGSAAVRMLLWKGATDLVAADPARAAVGYGPETLRLVFPRFAPPALAHALPRDRTIDRAHNETLDSLLMTGVLGLAAQIALFALVFAAGLGAMGVMRDAAERRRIVRGAVLGAALGAILPSLLDGGLRFAGVGLPLGMVAGMLASLIAGRRETGAPAGEGARAQQLLLAGLLAALLAHFVEIQVGIATSVTRLLFWVYSALVLGSGRSAAAKRPPHPSASDSEGLSPMTASLLVGFALMVLTYDFAPSMIDLAGRRVAFLALFGGTWLISTGLICADGRGGSASWRERLLSHAATSLAPWLCCTASYALWQAWNPVDRAAFFYLATLGFVALPLLGVARRAGQFTPAWRLAAYALAGAGALAAIVRTNLDLSRADALSRAAEVHRQHGRAEDAYPLAVEALGLAPASQRYATELARTLLDRARARSPSASSDAERDRAAALTLLEHCRSAQPLDPEPPRNIARLHRSWAAADPSRRADHLADAGRAYAGAQALLPNDAALLNERASLCAEQKDYAGALALLDRSLALDDRYGDTYSMRADVHFESEDFAAALADYERALAIRPTSSAALAAWSGKALALARLGRVTEAIEANRRALAIKPGDVIAHRNLALLYRQTGRLDQALLESEAARARAAPRDQRDLDGFIESLRGELAASARDRPRDQSEVRSTGD